MDVTNAKAVVIERTKPTKYTRGNNAIVTVVVYQGAYGGAKWVADVVHGPFTGAGKRAAVIKRRIQRNNSDVLDETWHTADSLVRAIKKAVKT